MGGDSHIIRHDAPLNQMVDSCVRLNESLLELGAVESVHFEVVDASTSPGVVFVVQFEHGHVMRLCQGPA